jgi:hypothetical protein
VVAGTLLAFVAPVLGDATQDAMRRYIAQCDESLSISRIASAAPDKFVGKKVDLRGFVGTIYEGHYDLWDKGGLAAIHIEGNAKRLKENQPVRVLGVVITPIESLNSNRRVEAYPAVQAVYTE